MIIYRQLQKLAHDHRTISSFDATLFRDKLHDYDEDNPNIYDHYLANSLETMPFLYFCDPKTLKISTSDIITGSKKIDLSGQHVNHYMKYSKICQPLKFINLTITINWDEFNGDIVNLNNELRSACEDNESIKTLTADNLKKNWWSKGMQLAKNSSNYTVIKGELEENDDPFTPLTRTHIKLFDPVSKYHDDCYLKNERLTPSLSLYCRYRQSHKERMKLQIVSNIPNALQERSLNFHINNINNNPSINLKGKTFPEAKIANWQKNHQYSKFSIIKWNRHFYKCLKSHNSANRFKDDLQFWLDIGPFCVATMDDKGKFFNTNRGIFAIKSALKAAENHILYSLRNFIVELIFPLTLQTIAIDCDTTLEIFDIKISKNKIYGKVIQSEIIFEKGLSFTKVKLAVCKNSAGQFIQPVINPDFANITKDDIACVNTYGTDIAHILLNKSFLKKITIENDFSQQMAMLQKFIKSKSKITTENLNKWLYKNRTKISLTLQKINKQNNLYIKDLLIKKPAYPKLKLLNIPSIQHKEQSDKHD